MARNGAYCNCVACIHACTADSSAQAETALPRAWSKLPASLWALACVAVCGCCPITILSAVTSTRRRPLTLKVESLVGKLILEVLLADEPDAVQHVRDSALTQRLLALCYKVSRQEQPRRHFRAVLFKEQVLLAPQLGFAGRTIVLGQVLKVQGAEVGPLCQGGG